jgi:hypothetical protein
MFDPVVTYDESAGRFVVAALFVDNTAGAERSHLDIAVSSGPNLPAGNPLSGFTVVNRINVLETSNNLFGTKFWADHTKIGWNADAIVVTMNMYTFGGSTVGPIFDHVQVVSLLKSTLRIVKVDLPAIYSTVVPAKMRGTVSGGLGGGPVWLVEAERPNPIFNANTIHVIQMTSPLTVNPGFTYYNVSVTSDGDPPPAHQVSGTVDAGDSRMQSVAFRDDRLVATHTVNNSGSARARWYEFNVGGAAPALAQEGAVNLGAGIDTYYPSIEIAANGDLGMTFMASSATMNMSMWVTGQTPTDPHGLMPTALLERPGQAYYAGTRAGDYSGISVDPVDGTSFWAANEYKSGTTTAFTWSTAIADFTLQQATPV